MWKPFDLSVKLFEDKAPARLNRLVSNILAFQVTYQLTIV